MPAGRADVPRERVGLPVLLRDDRRQAGLSGPHLDPVSLLEDFEQERVTVTAGVPTIWMGILQTLDANPGAYDLSSIRDMIVGGAAAAAGDDRGVLGTPRPPRRRTAGA